jgi:hypothetical protein
MCILVEILNIVHKMSCLLLYFCLLLHFPIPPSSSFYCRLFIQNLKKMIFLWFFLAFLVFMVLNFGNRHVNEEDDSGHSHSDLDYPMNEGEEGGEGDDNEVDSGKASLTPLWRYVTKLEEGRGGGTAKFLCPHGCRPGKPYTGSYTRVRRHLCGVLDNDDNRRSIGIAIFPKITQEQRENYIKIEEAAQRMNTKKQKVQPDASSPVSSSSVGGRYSPSGSGSRSGSKRTIEDFLDITGKEEVDAKVARFLYACGV